MVFCKTGGRGVSEGSEKTILLFWKSIFFQRACRIILGPPKHVLHLVWSAFVKYTANRTALKVALYDFLDGPPAPLNSQLMEKVNHYNLTKKINFSMGPSVKFVLAIIDSIPRASCLMPQNLRVFIFEYFPRILTKNNGCFCWLSEARYPGICACLNLGKH